MVRKRQQTAKLESREQKEIRKKDGKKRAKEICRIDMKLRKARL
jgi:hypothetical protein